MFRDNYTRVYKYSQNDLLTYLLTYYYLLNNYIIYSWSSFSSLLRTQLKSDACPTDVARVTFYRLARLISGARRWRRPRTHVIYTLRLINGAQWCYCFNSEKRIMHHVIDYGQLKSENCVKNYVLNIKQQLYYIIIIIYNKRIRL